MKRIKLLLASALATAFVLLSSAFVPVVAFAEEPKNEPATNENIVDEEVVEEEKTVENTPNDEAIGGGVLTFDELLEMYKDIAENAGFTDEWEKAVYYIEKAASAKKVDAMILVNVAFVLLFIGDRIVKIVRWNKERKTDTTKQDIVEIKTLDEQQTTAINALIDEVEGEKVAVNDCVEREKVLAHALEKQNVAIRSLIRGTNIKQDLKDESFRALNDSDKLCVEAKE